MLGAVVLAVAVVVLGAVVLAVAVVVLDVVVFHFHSLHSVILIQK